MKKFIWIMAGVSALFFLDAVIAAHERIDRLEKRISEQEIRLRAEAR